MPFIEFDESMEHWWFSRTALIGLPNSWKTSSLKTWPHSEERPMLIISLPGEGGVASIPKEPGIRAFVFRTEKAKVSAESVKREVDQITAKALGGEYGQLQTIVFDGFHQYYKVLYEAAFDGLKMAFPSQDDEKLSGRAYGGAHSDAYAFLRWVNGSHIPYTVFTMWVGKDNDAKDSEKPQMHVWPDLPGELRIKVMGQFGCVLYAEPGEQISPPTKTTPAKYSEGTWQTRKHGVVWGCGHKLSLERSRRVPTVVKQDWKALERLAFPELFENKDTGEHNHD